MAFAPCSSRPAFCGTAARHASRCEHTTPSKSVAPRRRPRAVVPQAQVDGTQSPIKESEPPPNRNANGSEAVAPEYIRVEDAQQVVWDAVRGRSGGAAVRALIDYERQGFYASHAVSKPVMYLLLASGNVGGACNLLERLCMTVVDGRPLPHHQALKRRPTLGMVLQAAKRAVELSRVDVMLHLVQLMGKYDLEPSVRTYTMLMVDCSRRKLPDGVSGLLREAVFTIGPHVWLYNTALESYIWCRMLKRAEACVEEARAQGVTLVGRTFYPLLREYHRRRDFAAMHRTFTTMHQLAIRPSANSINSFLKSAVQNGRLDLAHSMLHTAVSSELWTERKAIAYSTVVQALAFNGQVAQAVNLMNKMLPDVDVADRDGGEQLSVQLVAILTALMKSGATATAWKMFRRVESCNLAPDVYRVVIRGLALNGTPESLQSAEQLVASMVAKFNAPGATFVTISDAQPVAEQLVKAYNSVMVGYVRTQCPGEAERVFKELRRSGFTPSTNSYTILLSAFANVKDMANARRVLAMMQDDGLAVDRVTLNVVLGGYARIGDVRAGEKLFAEMLASDEEAMRPDGTSYSALISTYFRGKYYDAGWAKYAEMKSKGMKPSVHLIDRMLVTLVRGPYAGMVTPTFAASKERRSRELAKDMAACAFIDEATTRRWAKFREQFGP